MWFRLQVRAPQPRRPLNVPAILDAFEKAARLDTPPVPDAPFWLDVPLLPGASLLPNAPLLPDAPLSPDASLPPGAPLSPDTSLPPGAPLWPDASLWLDAFLWPDTPLCLNAGQLGLLGGFEGSNPLQDQACSFCPIHACISPVPLAGSLAIPSTDAAGHPPPPLSMLVATSQLPRIVITSPPKLHCAQRHLWRRRPHHPSTPTPLAQVTKKGGAWPTSWAPWTGQSFSRPWTASTDKPSLIFFHHGDMTT